MMQPERPHPERWEADIKYALDKRGASNQCPRCLKQEAFPSDDLLTAQADRPGWKVIDKPIKLLTSNDPRSKLDLRTGAVGVFDAIALICTNCGFIALHSAAVLDL